MPPSIGAPRNLDDPRNITGAISYDKAVNAALSDTGVKGLKEVLDYEFYDSVTIASAATTTSKLFATASTDLAISNFVGQGQMPSGQALLVQYLRVAFAPACTVADAQALSIGVAVQFVLENSKKYAEGLARQFPAGVGVTVESFSGITTPTAGASLGNNGVAALNNVYRFRRPVVLHSQQPFFISLQALAPTLAATTRVMVYIGGVYVRNVL